MEEENKIKIIIADDNKAICRLYQNYLKKFNTIEILAIVNTDEDEISAIEHLNPDVVITDLVRNGRYSGLDIIKTYAIKGNKPEFLVISADEKKDVIPSNLHVAGYIKKPFFNYDIILEELYKIMNIKENLT